MLKISTSLAATFLVIFLYAFPAFAATSLPFTINMSEAVNVTGTPRVALDVGGVTRYATYISGTGTSALTFTYDAVAGDVDLDGITVSSPIDLNGGSIKDLSGNDISPLTFTVPNTANLKVNYPSLGMDFIYDADGRYTLNSTVYNDLPSFLSATGGTFSRGSVGTYFDSAGTLQTAASGVPRFDYDPTTHAAKGILFEESRTNYVPNAEEVGFAAGSPGTAPANWIVSANNTNGLTRTIVGTGTLNGIKYVDIRWSGTSTGTGSLQMDPQLSAVSVASNGQAWTASAYLQIIAGSIPSPANFNITVIERNSAATYLSATSAIIPAAGGWKKYSVSRTFNEATVAYSHIGLRIDGLIVGSVIDVTVRIGAPQLELGAYATSYIPTTTAAVTRAADLLYLPVGSWYNATESTLFSDSFLLQSLAGPFIATLYESGSDYFGIRYNGTNYFSPRRNDGVGADLSLGGTFAANASSKIALYNGTAGVSASRDGGAIANNSTVISPNVNTLQVGGLNMGGGISTVSVKKIKYYPARVLNTQLQLLTQ